MAASVRVHRGADGGVTCGECGAAGLGEGFEYPVMWRLSPAEDEEGQAKRLGKRRSRGWRPLACLQLHHGPADDGAQCTQGFHDAFSHTDSMAHAVDFALPPGTPILAGRAGVVVDAMDAFSKGGGHAKYKSKANFVVVRHADGTYARYYHLQKGSVPVRKGASVLAGDQIGRCGSTGFSLGPHLHFDVVDCHATETSTLKVFADGGGGHAEALGPSHAFVDEVPSSFACFSAQLALDDVVSGALVMAQPPTIPGHTLDNAAEVQGRVVLCWRGGGSTFLNKALAARRAGAAALIIADNDRSNRGILPLVGGSQNNDDNGDGLDIPVVVVSHDSGLALQNRLDMLRAGGRIMAAEVGVSEHFALRMANQPPGLPFCKPQTMPVAFEEGVLEKRAGSIRKSQAMAITPLLTDPDFDGPIKRDDSLGFDGRADEGALSADKKGTRAA